MASSDQPREAQLETVKFTELLNGSGEQKVKLFNACKHHGFFYLDLTGFDPETRLDAVVEDMSALAGELFDLPEEQKMQYDVDKISKMKVCGYKPLGRNTGGIGGKHDGFETFVIPKELPSTGQTLYPLPATIEMHLHTIRQFALSMLTINRAILSSLSEMLELPHGHRLEDLHRPSEASPDIIRFLRYHVQPAHELGAPHTPHTDIGTTTILFARDPGLQVLPAGAKQWEYVMPRANHAIINLGDGMKLLTNGLFQSCLHRVAPMPGQAMQKRHSLVYLLRAEDGTPMTGIGSSLFPARDSNDEVLTSKAWLQKKYQGLRLATYNKQQDDWRVTGRKEGVIE